jgi:hypothetical protein
MLNSRARQFFHTDPYNSAHLLILLYCQLECWARQGRAGEDSLESLQALLPWAGFRRHHAINSVIHHQLAVVFTRMFDNAISEFRYTKVLV